MRVGDVVRVRGAVREYRGAITTTWKPRRGEQYVFLVLGVEPQSVDLTAEEISPDEVDARAVLRRLGWVEAEA